MADKIYEYNGKHYCETDLSMTDDKYEGDLFDLYFELERERKVTSDTIYYLAEDATDTYDTPEELIEECFDDCVIGEAGEQK